MNRCVCSACDDLTFVYLKWGKGLIDGLLDQSCVLQCEFSVFCSCCWVVLDARTCSSFVVVMVGPKMSLDAGPCLE